MQVEREVYVVSDLHIGGAWPAAGEGGRGFRICTRTDALTDFVSTLAARRGPALELVINGDFVDFLAEPDPGGGWRPYIADGASAADTLRGIVARDRPLFDALRALMAAGHRLTVLLGNHDLELSFPPVRRALRAAVGATDRFGFVYDGEAYRVGDALIEHGNRYDGFNVVDHDALRQVRSLQSRGQAVDVRFPPPLGSRLVAEVMNPIKARYPFVDLLKPETEAVLPMLLALEPGLRDRVRRILRLAAEAELRDPKAPARPRFDANISDRGGDQDAFDADVGSGVVRMLGWAWLKRGPDGLGRRLEALADALGALRDDTSFDRGIEGQANYLEAARALATGPIRHVVFGHTHLAKRVSLPSGGFYLNTGTWADLLRVPPEAIAGDRDALWRFVTDLASGHLEPCIEFSPTYARLDLVGEHVVEAALLDA